MKLQRGMLVHLGLLLVASGLAFSVWNRSSSEASALSEDANVSVWKGRAEQIERIEFESKNRHVQMQLRKDSHGVYLLGRVTTKIEVSSGKKDAGAATKKTQQRVKTFIAASSAKKFLERIASLKAYRSVGKVSKERDKEFGLDRPDGTIVVKVAGSTHRLTVGGLTPGGLDRYVRDERGLVFAIPGGLIRDVRNADTRLMQRDLHAWSDEEAASIRMRVGSKEKKFVRLSQGSEAREARGWACASTPTKRDETVENWMNKLGRLRGISYAPKDDESFKSAKPVVQVTYFDRHGNRIGFTELLKSSQDESPTYFVRSEQTRLAMKVLSSTAKQVEEDLGSVLR